MNNYVPGVARTSGSSERSSCPNSEWVSARRHGARAIDMGQWLVTGIRWSVPPSTIAGLANGRKNEERTWREPGDTSGGVLLKKPGSVRAGFGPKIRRARSDHCTRIDIRWGRSSLAQNLEI